jgi:acetylxylan esterase
MLSLHQAAKGLLALGLYVSSATGASLQQVSNWGGNPSGLAAMHIYVPDRLAANPAIIVGVSQETRA